MEYGLSLRTITTRAFWTSTGTCLNGVKDWSVSLSGLSRLRTVGPHEKLGRHETSSILDLTQSSQRLSHLDVTQTSGIMMFPSPFNPEKSLPTWNPNCLGFSLPLQTDRSSYHYLWLSWIWANWATRTTFRIGPSKDDGTSSEAQAAWIWIPPGSHHILPAAIPPRRYPTIWNNKVSFPLHLERFH